jgi:DNA-binding NarL/FixJ family response regulator
MMNQVSEEQSFNMNVVNHSSDPLDIMAAVCSHKPALLILDDDFLEPNSAHILSSIRKVNEKLEIIFVTSNSGLEIGRAVSQIGIHYYAIKPLEQSELSEVVLSLNKIKLEQNH